MNKLTFESIQQKINDLSQKGKPGNFPQYDTCLNCNALYKVPYDYEGKLALLNSLPDYYTVLCVDCIREKWSSDWENKPFESTERKR